MIAWLWACATPTVAPEVVFVRDGVVLGAGTPEQRFVWMPWSPGEAVRVGDVKATAPRKAECVALFRQPLGDGSSVSTFGGTDTPDTVLVFSPDGARLAVGTAFGDVWVLDGWSGAVLARRRLAESLIRELVWSSDGTVIYAAEQSSDAFVHALSADGLSSLARHRLADHVGSSPAPAPGDPYGVYTLPAAYGLALDGGDLLVAAAHGWDTADGRKNASRVLRLDGAHLSVKAVWPTDRPLDGIISAMAVDGGVVAFAVRRSADGPVPKDVVVDGVQRLAARDLAPLTPARFEPLKPYYERVFIWDALAILADGGIAAGLGDGRLVVQKSNGSTQVATLGTPVLVGDVPIGAPVGFLRADGNRLYSVTSETGIPYGSAAAALRPPAAHAGENRLWAHDLGNDGTLSLAWSLAGPGALAGLALGSSEVAVGLGTHSGNEEGRVHGAAVARLDGTDGWSAVCATEGPVHHRPAIAADGRVAVAEVPVSQGGVVRGTYRVTVFR